MAERRHHRNSTSKKLVTINSGTCICWRPSYNIQHRR